MTGIGDLVSHHMYFLERGETETKKKCQNKSDVIAEVIFSMLKKKGNLSSAQQQQKKMHLNAQANMEQ